MKVKHIGLITGLCLVIFSFLFFGRQHGIYQLLQNVGLFVSLVFYLTVLFGKGTVKSKLLWTVVIILAITLQWLSEPLLIKCSYLIYLNNHNSELNEVNKILVAKSEDIYIFKDGVNDKQHQLSNSENESLIKLREKLDVYIISKSDNNIYYGFWGFLDVRFGITYLINNNPNSVQKPLKDKWYY